MRSLLLLPALTLLMTGCGGDTPRAKKVEKKEQAKPTSSSDPVTVSNTPPPSRSTQPPPPPRATGFEKTATPAQPAATKPTTTTTVAKSGGDEFGPDLMSGKTVGKWVAMLESGKKDDVLEALEVFRIGKGHPGAKKALPKITELMKNPDAEIAKAATDAVEAIGK